MESTKLTTNLLRIAFNIGWIFSLGLCFPVAAQHDSPQKAPLHNEHSLLTTSISEYQIIDELKDLGVSCRAHTEPVLSFKVDKVKAGTLAASSGIADGDEILSVSQTSKFISLTLQRGPRKFNVRLGRPTTRAPISTDLDDAVNLYKTGDYNAARFGFWRRSQENPKDYISHYYLANSFIQMKDFKNARTWYKNCLHCNPDAETAQNCSKALSYLNESTGTDANGSAKRDSHSSATNSSATGSQSTSTNAGLRSPLSCPSRDTAGEAVTRHVKQPPIGLVKYLDETDRPNSNISFLVKYGLETIPEQVLTNLMSAGYSVVIAPTILDAMPRRSGYSPRGYGDDANYDNAAALFKTDSRQILIAEKLQLSKNSPDYKNNDFATDAVRHELGHAVDCNAGYPSRRSEFKAAYDKDERKLSAFDRNRFAYFLQPGDSGRSELFAQFFAAKYTPDNWQNKQMIDLLNVFPDVIPLMKDY
jgi:hypothetical protein